MGFLCISAVGALVWLVGTALWGWLEATGFTLIIMPLVMWLAIRMLEDGTAALRSAKQLFHILLTSPDEWKALKQQREQLVKTLSGVATPEVRSRSSAEDVM